MARKKLLKSRRIKNGPGRDGAGGRSRAGSEARRRAARGDAVKPSCGTAYAAEILRTGVLPPRSSRRSETIPHEGERIRMGDPDDDCLANEYVGDETPGGTSPTPDQNVVDEIGRAYGLQEEDAGELHSASEVLTRRDRKRAELKAPRNGSR